MTLDWCPWSRVTWYMPWPWKLPCKLFEMLSNRLCWHSAATYRWHRCFVTRDDSGRLTMKHRHIRPKTSVIPHQLSHEDGTYGSILNGALGSEIHLSGAQPTNESFSANHESQLVSARSPVASPRPRHPPLRFFFRTRCSTTCFVCRAYYILWLFDVLEWAAKGIFSTR
ncbi:hypothetical protein V8C42DRAFT_235435 [Trichoderma barbatum]